MKTFDEVKLAHKEFKEYTIPHDMSEVALEVGIELLGLNRSQIGLLQVYINRIYYWETIKALSLYCALSHNKFDFNNIKIVDDVSKGYGAFILSYDDRCVYSPGAC